MKKLSNDWFLEGTLDLEYKKYVLLAYMQYVGQEFAQYHLYPSFSDLVFHYNNLHQFRENKRKLSAKFPTKLNQEEFRKLKLQYDPGLADSPDLLEIEAIVDYSMPVIQQHLAKGKEIYELIDDDLQIEPIGIVPLYRNEGYVLLKLPAQSDVRAYTYRIAFFENTEANYYGISFSYRDSFRHSLANTFENMKRSLVQQFRDMPNPATYLLESRELYPESSALIPVAKRKMLAYLKGER